MQPHVTSRLARLLVRIGKPRELQISVTNDDSTGKNSYVLYTELSVQRVRVQLGVCTIVVFAWFGLKLASRT